MKASISGRELRDSLLARLAQTPARREADQLAALDTPGNRERLVAIAKFGPRSIVEQSSRLPET